MLLSLGGALLSASLPLRRIDIVKLRWSAQTNLPQTELPLKCLVMVYCEANHPHLQTMHNLSVRPTTYLTVRLTAAPELRTQSFVIPFFFLTGAGEGGPA
jgi:hypothetical protein